LYEIAGGLTRRERKDCSLQPTMLVHDAFLALGRQRNLRGSTRPTLLAAAAQFMRRLLIDRARARRRIKRGGEKSREALPTTLADVAKNNEALEVHDAIDALRRHCEMTARIVELRFFGGMSHAEIAAATGISERTIGEKWRFAKAWLHRAMNPRTSGE
jgi:RNA polymerase sigma factor (TIGR02999 family)